MPYAVRNAEGQITSLHRHDPGVGDVVDGDDPEVLAFLGLVEAPEPGEWADQPSEEAPLNGFSHEPPAAPALDADTQSGFNRLDADFIRVLEDVIDALLSRNVLTVTDLPDVAQTKLFARKSYRERRPKNALDLFREGDVDNVI